MEAVSMRAQLLALVLCVIGCAKQGVTPGPKEGTDGTPPDPMAKTAPALVAPTVPPDLVVPEGHKLTFMAMAKGVQMYDCVAEGAAAPAWKLHAPRADLLDDAGTTIGSHYGGVDKSLPPGPYWESKDGSRVHAGKPVTAPNAGSIPLLRLEAADTSGTGVFSKVKFVHRLDTTGGVAPAGACTAGKTTEVAYTAKYYFYSTP
jgi:Protein of unknown function (DUF3455)